MHHTLDVFGYSKNPDHNLDTNVNAFAKWGNGTNADASTQCRSCHCYQISPELPQPNINARLWSNVLDSAASIRIMDSETWRISHNKH